ncbi:MAG: type II secretion system F family protein [Alphaproteobacteria bacterium]|nr:type II secretion system F family protein [Alphaproteobacteria bacterium]
MPNFRYRALTQAGELVNGELSAPTAREVARRIEYLGLVPIETVAEDSAAAVSRATIALFNRPRPEDVTVFTRDLALLLKAGARLDDALELLAGDTDIGRLQPVIAKVRAGILAGESFAEAIGKHGTLFPGIYVALVQVGESSGKLTHILETIADERARSEGLRRKLMDALQYPTMVLLAAVGVLIFFTVVVLPQFSSVLRDFGAKSDSAIVAFLGFSDFVRAHGTAITASAAGAVIAAWLMLRRKGVRSALIAEVSRLPGISTIFNFYRTALFCRNLGILLSSDVTLTATLRILVDIMAVTGRSEPWTAAADRVRHGGKLSDALSAQAMLPPMAIRMLRIGEETGQMPALSSRIADFYEAKLQRSLDRIVGIIGPVAIVTISLVVGGLIVSVMTALLSITQVIG